MSAQPTPLAFRALALGLAVATLTATAAPAIAASASFNVTLNVPAECFVQTPGGAVVVNDGGTAAGNVVEACNVPGGYTVKANYRSLASDEGATLQYNGQTISLPSDGKVTVHTSTVATIKQVAYTLQPTHLSAPLTVTFTIQPA